MFLGYGLGLKFADFYLSKAYDSNLGRKI